MSYLLTEIALDMLGYKFYDINGTYRITDFQADIPPTDINEPNLEDILFPKDQSKSAKDQSKSADTNPDDDSDECIVVPNTPEPSTSGNRDQHQLILQNIKESIDKEVDTLQEEIYQHKTKFIESNIKVIKKRDKSAKINPKEILKSFSEQEKNNIRSEAELMGEFLKNVEQQLEEANPEQFKKLKRYRMEEYL